MVKQWGHRKDFPCLTVPEEPIVVGVPVHVEHQGIQVHHSYILLGSFGTKFLKLAVVLAIVLFIQHHGVGRLKVIPAFREVFAADVPILVHLIVGHGEAHHPAQVIGEQLGKLFQVGARFQHPPGPIVILPTLFIASGVGQLWGACLGSPQPERIRVATEGQPGKGVVFLKSYLVIGQVLIFPTEPVSIGYGGPMHPQHRRQVIVGS